MYQELVSYANGLITENKKADVLLWLERREAQHQLTDQQEVEHILDFFNSDKAPKNFVRMSYKDAKKKSEDWVEVMNKKACEIVESPEDTEVVLDFKDGFKIVKLVGQNAYKREGFLMSHCVASYYGKNVEVYSLRDSKNMPHCTMEKDAQIKGKGNGSIHPKYIDYVVKFLEFCGMEVRDSEMLNLGYLNYEGILDELHDDIKARLFRDKYGRPNEKLILKDKSEIESPLDLLDKKPLIAETKTGLEVSFDLPYFVKFSASYLYTKLSQVKPGLTDKGNYSQLAASGDYSKLAASGNYSKLATSGNYSQLAASGYDSKLAASGNYSQLAASGNDSKLAASGDSSQLAASGNYSQLAASGDSSKLAASGYSSQLAASGYDSKLAASGNDSKLAASGNYSKLAASGDSSQLAASGNDSQLAASGYDSKLAASGNYSQLAASGDSSQLAASGNSSKLAASGNYSKLAASGNYSKLAASGNDSKLATSGDYSQLELNGKDSVGAAIGINSRIKGKKGCWITLAEYGDNNVILCVKSAKIDGKKLKEDVWYELKGKKFVEVE